MTDDARREDGGPAFGAVTGGLSVRDYFAAAALPVVLDLARPDPRENGETFEEMVARKTYRVAGAMLKERARAKTQEG